MIPLLFIAIALGGLAAAYELSPKAHAWTDEHVQAIRDALTAHRDADAKITEAQAAMIAHMTTEGAPDPWAAQGTPSPGAFDPAAAWAALQAQGGALLQHAYDMYKAARQSNALAAVHATTAINTATTPQQKAAAKQGAAAVSAQQQQIVAEMARLGGGQCGARTYPVTAQLKDVLLAKLHAKGMTVTASGPSQWDVDTGMSGVILRAVWDPQAQVLHLIVTASDPLAPCFAIWGKIDPTMKEILGS